MSLPSKRFQCSACGNIIEIPQGEPKPPSCPRCGAPGTMIHRLDKGPPRGVEAGLRPGGGLSPSSPFFNLSKYVVNQNE